MFYLFSSLVGLLVMVGVQLWVGLVCLCRKQCGLFGRQEVVWVGLVCLSVLRKKGAWLEESFFFFEADFFLSIFLYQILYPTNLKNLPYIILFYPTAKDPFFLLRHIPLQATSPKSKMITLLQLMSIIYSLVGKDNIILCDHTDFSGNFTLTAQQILRACHDVKYTRYPASNYMFYIINQGCVFLVMCEKEYSERVAFTFLKQIQEEFMKAFNEQRISNAKMYEMKPFVPILKAKMKLYNKPELVDKLASLSKETDEVDKITRQNLDKTISRGEKITILAEKTETMAALSLDFKSSARTVRNQMAFENWKWKIILGLIILVAIYLLMVIICGGFTLSGCF